MKILSIEIKAKIDSHTIIKKLLNDKGADYKGIDHQIDYYFNSKTGRLKLRQGQIEHNLIYYERPESNGLKSSEILLQSLPAENDTLLKILSKELGIFKIVDKKRHIYFIDHVKFHLDEVKGLGYFVEIEALGMHADVDKKTLELDCQYYIDYFGLDEKSFVAASYSDLI